MQSKESHHYRAIGEEETHEGLGETNHPSRRRLPPYLRSLPPLLQPLPILIFILSNIASFLLGAAPGWASGAQQTEGKCGGARSGRQEERLRE